MMWLKSQYKIHSTIAVTIGVYNNWFRSNFILVQTGVHIIILE